MTKNRIVYLIWLAAVGMLHVFGNEFGTRVILVASVAVPVIIVFLAWVSSRLVTVELILPTKRECGEKFDVSINIRGEGFLVGRVKTNMLCQNLLTGESYEKNEIEFTVEAIRCGMMSFSVTQLATVDMFGLFVWKIKKKPQGNIFIAPKYIDISYEAADNEVSVLDGEIYSANRPGNDPSETFAIRDYVPGDLLRSIHWKLSQKTDKLLVREMGMPIAQKIMILMETSDLVSAKEIDEEARCVYNYSHRLASQGVEHVVGWLDTTTLMFESRNITNFGEFDEVFSELFSNKVKKSGITTIEAYNDWKNEDGYIVIYRVGGMLV